MFIFFTIVIIIAFNSKELRISLFNIIRLATSKIMLKFFLIIIIYVSLWIKLLSTLSIWDWTFLKDILIWVIFIGIPICGNATNIKSETYFKDTLINSFKIIIFLEFIINTFTFNLIVEIIIIPVATLIVLFNAVAATDKAYEPARKLFSFLEVTFGFIVLYYAIDKATTSYFEYNSANLLISFSIPILFTILFIPLSYFFAVYSKYEILFIKMNFRMPNSARARRYAKWKVFKVCRFSLNKIQKFEREFLKDLYSGMNKVDYDNIFVNFNNSIKNNKV